MVKIPPANAGVTGSIPGSERSPGARYGISCLENFMDRGAWQTTVHGVAKGWTQLSIHTHTHTHTHAKEIIITALL